MSNPKTRLGYARVRIGLRIAQVVFVTALATLGGLHGKTLLAAVGCGALLF